VAQISSQAAAAPGAALAGPPAAASAVAPGTAVLLALIGVGAALRFVALSHQSFWYDETVSTHLAQASLIDIFKGRSRDLGNPPFHLILLHIWTLLFGASDASARALSATAGAVSIPIAYFVARRLISRHAALFATALFALSPVQIYFGQEARTYTLVSLLCLASTAFLLRAVEARGRIGAWIGFAAMTFLAMYAHYFAAFVVVAQVVWILIEHRGQRVVWVSAFAALAGAGLVYAVVWLPSLVAQATTKGNLGRAADTWYLQVLATPLVFWTGTTLLWKGAVTAFRGVAAVIALAACVGGALAGVRSLRSNRSALVLLLAWLGLPVLLPLIVSLTLFPFYYARYALVAAPAYYMLIAAGVVSLEKRWRLAATGALAVTMVASLAFYFTALVKHDWRDAAAWVQANTRPGDVLAFDADIGETSFARYAGPDASRVRFLESPDRPQGARYWGTSSRKEPVHPVDSQLFAARRVWFVFSDPQSGAGDYYSDLFARDWRRVDGRKFRGIDVGLYERP
jgi:mannosyltransferase